MTRGLFILLLAGTLSGAYLTLSWKDVRHYERGALYRVTSATNMAGPWEYVATVPSNPTSGTMTVLLPVFLNTNEPKRFYRVARFFNADRMDDPLHDIRLTP